MSSPGHELSELLRKYKGEQSDLISILQHTQREFGYISPEAVSQVARFLRLSDSEVFGVASFYAQFRFTSLPKHSVKVCLGTACHVRGGDRILETMERELGIGISEVTPDLKFGLERIACFGSCSLAPVVVIDKDIYGRMTSLRAKAILAQHKEES